jgi:hypothetical protein
MAHGPVGRQPGGSLAASYGEEGAIRRGQAELRIGHGLGNSGICCGLHHCVIGDGGNAVTRKPAATAPALATQGLTSAPPCPEQPIRRESILAPFGLSRIAPEAGSFGVRG